MMHSQKVKLLLWFATLLSVLALVAVPALANGKFTLTVNKAGDGTGTVTSDDGKINCGAVCEATYYCEIPVTGKPMGHQDEEVVTLTATPDAGFVFTRWGENCGCNHVDLDSPRSKAGFAPRTCTIIVTCGQNRTCTANFGLPVGGIIVPVNKLELLAPWLGLAALASLAVLTIALVRRRRA